MDYDNQTDEELMAAYQSGSHQAFHVLYQRHSGKIYGYLKARVSSEQDVKELFQEVFIKLHRSKHLYNANMPVLPWIFSVTYSVMVDGLRRITKLKEDLNQNLDSFEAPVFVSRTADSLVGRLDGDQKAAVQMRFLEEKTFEEIAKTLKTSPINVRQIVSRAIKKLKRWSNE